MSKNCENNGMEEINLVTPTPGTRPTNDISINFKIHWISNSIKILLTGQAPSVHHCDLIWLASHLLLSTQSL